MPGPTKDDRLIGEQRATIERLERENADKQQRINRGVRDLDHIAFRLATAPAMETASVRTFALETQERLRGK